MGFPREFESRHCHFFAFFLRFRVVRVETPTGRRTQDQKIGRSGANEPITRYDALQFARVVLLVEENQRSIGGLNGLPGGWMPILVPITFIGEYRMEGYISHSLVGF